MGLNNRTGGKFITIYDGKFTQKVPAGTEGAISRVNKLGKEVTEMYYDSFTGKLVDIKTKESTDYGKSWEFILSSDDETYTLTLGYSNGLAKALLKMLPNINLEEEFTLSPSKKMVDGKEKTSLFVNQGGQVVKHSFTRENPNGMPEMVLIKVKGVDTWDDTAQLEFLQNIVNETFKTKESELDAF